MYAGKRLVQYRYSSILLKIRLGEGCWKDTCYSIMELMVKLRSLNDENLELFFLELKTSCA